jgi:hypothetical protein
LATAVSASEMRSRVRKVFVLTFLSFVNLRDVYAA